MKYDFDCVVVGAGVSGMTAAIYLKRVKLNVLIVDYDAPGGILNKVNLIENYPGFKSITGPELAYKVYEQVTNLNIEIRYGKVLSIENHIITTDIGKISANKVILAIGRKSKKITANQLKNISYCAVCDGNLYKNKDIAVIGNKNSINDIKYLSNIVNKIYLISTENIELQNANYKIDYIKGEQIKKLNEKDNLLDTIETNKRRLEVDGLFISLGYEPQSDFLKNVKKDNGYIIVDNQMKTNINYIYACGDIIKKDIYQLTTAVAEATIAAINVKKEL